ncbi:glycoside hydrolase family 31 protein [Laccaria amethystina LaAM-08-1]|uniref:Glycoside hydrolase family 31 protein n=1 Tax=Laccaria amethystina LaAM-08-1 TaxID=1095629 RepID=A0A0C9XEL5_9AGAR|nr:glycoside hydrolase family 31 protein [Laccaria amethystina LaAM-08-1]
MATFLWRYMKYYKAEACVKHPDMGAFKVLSTISGQFLRSLNITITLGVFPGAIAESKEDPSDVARQYMEVAGLPAEVPYWSFGFISVGLGINFVDVAKAISRYAVAGIPFDTNWIDMSTQNPSF